MKKKQPFKMIELTATDYIFSDEEFRFDIFSLRKKTFIDRLHWNLRCESNMEFDEYDNCNATYIAGTINGKILCSVRFIKTTNHNMITGTFCKFFSKRILPQGNFVEASRLFVDKNRLGESGLRKYPISCMLFLSMINYARIFNYEAIYAIVSHHMYIIFRRSGWKVEIIAEGVSEKNETIYLIHMPVNDLNRNILIKKITTDCPCDASSVTSWPLVIPLEETADELSAFQQPV